MYSKIIYDRYLPAADSAFLLQTIETCEINILLADLFSVLANEESIDLRTKSNIALLRWMMDEEQNLPILYAAKYDHTVYINSLETIVSRCVARNPEGNLGVFVQKCLKSNKADVNMLSITLIYNLICDEWHNIYNMPYAYKLLLEISRLQNYAGTHAQYHTLQLALTECSNDWR